MTNTNQISSTDSLSETANAPHVDVPETVEAEPTQSARVEPVEGAKRDETDPSVERTVEAASRIVAAAVDIGRTWAAYGLRVGKLALETHAQTMGKLAGALGEIDRTIHPREDAPRADDAASAR
jgi:hypothetical protein